MKTVYTPFQRRFRSQAIRLAMRSPRVRLMTSIPGFTYLRIGSLVIWRDGWRVGASWKGAV